MWKNMKICISRLGFLLVVVLFFSCVAVSASALAAPAPGKNNSARRSVPMMEKKARAEAQSEGQGLSYHPPPLSAGSPASVNGAVPVRGGGRKGGAYLGKFSREALVGKKATKSAVSRKTKVRTRKYTGAPTPDPHEKGAELADGRVTFSGSIPDHPNDRLRPQRAPLPGNAQTMSREEPASAPEMSVSYKVTDDAAARFTVNQQDDTSPNYTPITKENSLVSTGVYVDVDVRKNLQLQMGGEVRSIEVDGPGNTHDSRETGATVGLRWNF